MKMNKVSFLHGLMHPRSIAIVGASNNPSKMGTMHALSILKDGFNGPLYPIHPTEKIVLGQAAYSAVRDLPEAPDLAIFVLPAQHLPPLFEDFGKLGTKYAVIITAGFKETGEKGAAGERELVATARKYGMRFIGPNCMGVINRAISLNTTVSTVSGPPGSLGFISQSGTYVAQTVSYLQKRGIHFSKAVSVGNEADVSLVDVLEYLGEDAETKAISLYIESIRDVRRFLAVASKITLHKPVVAQYIGGSEAGARAGRSHTGAMAGQNHLYDGLFKQAGVIRVQSVEDLYGIGWALANQPPIRGNRIGIITNSGGPGSAIADTLEAEGCRVPPFSEALREKIRPLVPPHAPCGNPVDLTFSMDMEVMTETINRTVMTSGEIDGIVLHGAMSTGFLRIVYPHMADFFPGISIDDVLKNAEKDISKPVRIPFETGIPMTVSAFFDREDHYTRQYEDNGVPVYDSPEKAARAMGKMVEWMQIRERQANLPPEIPVPAEAASRIIATAIAENRKNLSEFEAKQLLGCYGIPVPEERLAQSAEETAEAASAIGFPVAVKGCHPDILHKTEAGLVHLNIADRESAERAFSAIQDAAGRSVPVLVSKMISGSRELLIGLTHDDQFGHCVAFGVGGIFTEALKDVTYRVAPVSLAAASEMMEDIRTRKLLGPYRGMPAVPSAALADLIQRISTIGAIHKEIKEIDINPLLVSSQTPVAVDALIVLV